MMRASTGLEPPINADAYSKTKPAGRDNDGADPSERPVQPTSNEPEIPWTSID